MAKLCVLIPNEKRFNHSLETALVYLGSKLDFPQKVSKQGLNQRFTTTMVDYLKEIFQQAMQFSISELLPIPIKEKFNIPGIDNIYIADTTTFTLPDTMKGDFRGCGGIGSTSSSSMKVFYEFNLKEQDEYFEFKEGKTSDIGFNDINRIKPRSLYIRDLGFKSAEFSKKIIDVGSCFIRRLYSKDKLTLVNQNGDISKDALTISEFMDKHLTDKKTRYKSYLSFRVYVGDNKNIRSKYGELRMICFRIPEEKAKEKLRKARKEAQRNGKALTAEKEFLCKWHICLTNLTNSQCTDEEVIELYRERWNIEIRFKGWKSGLGVCEFTKQSKERFECMMYGFLIYLLFIGGLIYRSAQYQQYKEAEKSTKRSPNNTSKTSLKEVSYVKLIQGMRIFHQDIVEAFCRKDIDWGIVLQKITTELAPFIVKEVKKKNT